MSAGLRSLSERRPATVGRSSQLLHFLALRASRLPGLHKITGAYQLFESPQPHGDLIKVLSQLGVATQLTSDSITIEGAASWRLHGDTLLVPTTHGGQLVSAVLLNAWQLPFDLYVSLSASSAPSGEWRMSVKMAQLLGMKLDFWDADFRVPKMQSAIGTGSPPPELIEVDAGQAFIIAALAAVAGHATLLDFPRESLQAEAQFVPILESMGVPLTWTKQGLKIERAARLCGVAANLRSCPALLPIVAALCALSDGESDLYGLSHLIQKESGKLELIVSLLKQTGRDVEIKSDSLVIRGERKTLLGDTMIVVDCEQDPQLGFAGAVLNFAGYPVTLINSGALDSVFPGFWGIVPHRPREQFN